MTLRIHGHAASINVRKVLWACDEMGITYDRIDRGGGLIPTSIDHDLCAQSRRPMDIIFQG